MTIADELDSAMKAFNGHKGISQAELAKKSGVPQPTISRTLKGVSQPETATLRKLAKFLGATIGGVSGDPAPPSYATPGKVTDFRCREEPSLDPPLAELLTIAQSLSKEGRYVLLGLARGLAKEYPSTKANQRK